MGPLRSNILIMNDQISIGDGRFRFSLFMADAAEKKSECTPKLDRHFSLCCAYSSKQTFCKMWLNYQYRDTFG